MEIINNTKSDFVKLGDLKPGDVFIYKDNSYIVVDRKNSSVLLNLSWHPEAIMIMNLVNNRIDGLMRWAKVKFCNDSITTKG